MANTMMQASQRSGMALAHAAPRTEIAASKSFLQGSRLQSIASAPRLSRKQLVTHNFKFMKNLGIKKPAFLPDFGLEKRKALLDKFFTSFDRSNLQTILSDDAQISQASSSPSLNKEGFINFVSEEVKPAFPDFTWSHTTSGEKDDAGYSIVRIQIAGTHTGKPFQVKSSKLSPVNASKKRLSLPEQTVKVKVEDGQIMEMQFLSKGADLQQDLYKAVGGKVPALK